MSELVVIAGLGNPGSKYMMTRHNFGFLFIDLLAESHKLKEEFNSAVVRHQLDGKEALLVKPLTYMNKSGEAISQILNFYKLSPSSLIVAHDEIDIPFSDVRVKKGGGDAGHNGLKNITALIGSNEYYRIRLGVGRPANSEVEIIDWVLGKFQKDELEMLPSVLTKAKSLMLERCSL